MSTELDSLSLSFVPDLGQVYRSGSPLLLAYETVGFSPNELTEIFKFDVLINGTQKSVFWLYDHKIEEFDEYSINENVAQKFSVPSDDITLSHVIISGATWDSKLTLTCSISGDNRVFISQIYADGSFIPDLIEHISGNLNVAEITRLASEKDIIFIETAAALSQVDAGQEISPQQLVLDTNESRDVYIVDPVHSHLKLASTVAGQIIQGNSELVDTFSDVDVTRLLIKTKESVSADDINEKYDFLIIDLDKSLSVKSLKWVANPDGSFFNQGITTARFYDSGSVLIETNSTNVEVQNFDHQAHFLRYEIETGALTVFSDIGLISDVYLTNVKLLDAASNNAFLLYKGTNVNGDGSEQVYLHSKSLTENSSEYLISTFGSNQLSVNDSVLSARMSDFGTRAALNLYNPTWVQGSSLSDEASFFVGSSLLSNIDLDFAPPTYQIMGIFRQEETLSVNSTLANNDGLSKLSYQWYAGDSVIEGETSSTLILDQHHVGEEISVSVVYSDQLGNETSFVVSATSSVENVNDAPMGSVTISGTAKQGETVTANVSALADADGLGTLSYQWKAGGTPISGATDSTYTLTQAEVGKAITVTASYTDGGGTVESVQSAATSAVVNVNDDPTGTVTITGTVRQGQVLTANTSALADADGLGTLSYQWKAGGTDITGATGSTYTPTQAEVGKTISVTVSYTDGGAHPEVVNSASTSAVLETQFLTAEITTTLTDRFGEALSGVHFSVHEVQVADNIFLREVSTGQTSIVFEIVAKATEAVSSIDFELFDNAGLIDFQVSDALSGWSIQTNTKTPDVVQFAGLGAVNGSTDLLAGQEVVLATFETSLDPDFVIDGIFLNTTAQADISVGEVVAFSEVGNVTVHQVARGSDVYLDADKPIDDASDRAITANDALQALRLAVGLTKSDGKAEWHDYLAADINQDGQVTANDALNILKFAVGLTDGPSADWVFVDGDADWSGIGRRNTSYEEGIWLEDVVTDMSVNMTGILVGDVNGSYVG